MRMLIDKAQCNLRNIQRYYINADNKTVDFAIDILRKYQKIEEIVKCWKDATIEEKDSIYSFHKILEVLEDGNEN